jgi:hypothetical protein
VVDTPACRATSTIVTRRAGVNCFGIHSPQLGKRYPF